MVNKELEIALTTYIALKHNQDECSGFIDAYTQCQEDMADKKYTEEDLENAFNSGRGYGVPDNIKDFNSFINSLNKQD
jgi:hypothetical protein